MLQRLSLVFFINQQDVLEIPICIKAPQKNQTLFSCYGMAGFQVILSNSSYRLFIYFFHWYVTFFKCDSFSVKIGNHKSWNFDPYYIEFALSMSQSRVLVVLILMLLLSCCSSPSVHVLSAIVRFKQLCILLVVVRWGEINLPVRSCICVVIM